MDQLSDVTRRTASDLESLGASVVALRARIEALEGQIEAVGGARAQTAARVENLASDMSRIGRLESSLAEARAETTRALDALSHRLSTDLHAGLDVRNRDVDVRQREVESLAARVAALEGDLVRRDLPDRLAGIARDAARLADRLQGAEERVRRLESLPRTDPAVDLKLAAFDERLAGLRTEFAAWQQRIDEQADVLREARLAAERSHGVADEMQRAHHATAEAQRLAEQRLDGFLRELREEIAARWTRFEQSRAHDWDRLADENRARDAQDQTLRQALADLQAVVTRVAGRIEEGLRERETAHSEIVQRLSDSLGGLTEAVDAVRRSLEEDMPLGERSEVVHERRLADRRAFRARRAAREQ